MEAKRGFYWLNKAWYGVRDEQDQIMFGLYVPGGGTPGEMSMRWDNVGGTLTPVLRAYDDAWAVLASCVDLLLVLANHDNANIPATKFVEILKAHGFADLTRYDRAAKLA
jgi:hypothetical protein